MKVLFSDKCTMQQSAPCTLLHAEKRSDKKYVVVTMTTKESILTIKKYFEMLSSFKLCCIMLMVK